MQTTTEFIKMVDLQSLYQRLHVGIDEAIYQTLLKADFINGASVGQFQRELATYLNVCQVVTCANGTDALQIALMGLRLHPGDEVLIPAFTYVATAEVIALLGLTPVWVDVDPQTFNLTTENVEKAITPRTRAIVPVHLFGQCADMEPLMNVANTHNLFVIEDAAQAIGAAYTFSDGAIRSAGAIGHVGCTSFFPSKNLGCFGDGGAVYTNDEQLADRLRMIANHGQRKKYVHEIVGINSRLDTLQAAVLSVKLQHLTDLTHRRQLAADIYDLGLAEVPNIQIPFRTSYSTHVFHQYTLLVNDGRRDGLQVFLSEHGIPSMIYYPVPMHEQPAYRNDRFGPGSFPVAEHLSRSVLSLPMHTELTVQQQDFIIATISKFMNR